MSQFRKYFVAELKGIPSVPMTHRTKPAFADHDINWEYFEVIEVAALEAAQKEIEQLKDSNENIRSHLLYQTKISNQLLNEKEQLTAALKVAEDALEHIIEVQNFLGGSSVLQQDCEQALLEIQKIKKGLG